MSTTGQKGAFVLQVNAGDPNNEYGEIIVNCVQECGKRAKDEFGAEIYYHDTSRFVDSDTTKKRVVSEKADTTPKVGKSVLDFVKKSSCVRKS
ncbi:MAG: hypothetical protein QM296_10115 [Bacillota bacterium]|nr:hypothetical protein [Bacillota bacterium]